MEGAETACVCSTRFWPHTLNISWSTFMLDLVGGQWKRFCESRRDSSLVWRGGLVWVSGRMMDRLQSWICLIGALLWLTSNGISVDGKIRCASGKCPKICVAKFAICATVCFEHVAGSGACKWPRSKINPFRKHRKKLVIAESIYSQICLRLDWSIVNLSMNALHSLFVASLSLSKDRKKDTTK